MSYLNSSVSNRWKRVAVFIAILVVLAGAWQLLRQPEARLFLAAKNWLEVPWPAHPGFAGEELPLTKFYVREAWEREFLATLGQDFQNILYLKRAVKMFPTIEAALAAGGVPDDFKYLAVAESGLREDVASHAGASGVWQFVPATARRYGLVVNDEVDERNHFEKATGAAVKYLNDLHKQFGSWTLAAAAYNLGENGLARRLREQHVNNYFDTLMPDETERYVFRIAAIKAIFQYAGEYGYTLGKTDGFAEPATTRVAVGAVTDLAAWAEGWGTTLRAVHELNPWILGATLPAGNWEVRVPSQ